MNGYIVLTTVLLVGCAIVCIILSRHAQKQIKLAYQNILQKLDRAIGGEKQDTVYDESMNAAITERLNRIVQISGMNQGKVEKERDNVKSLISDISHQIRTVLAGEAARLEHAAAVEHIYQARFSHARLPHERAQLAD